MKILDVACGGKCFYYDKNNPLVTFMDIRVREQGHRTHRPKHTIQPDIVGDFRNIQFKDNSFDIVVFDPPHIITKKPEASDITKAYGSLERSTWKEDIKKGFDECIRVLKPTGTLVFKWGEVQIKKRELITVLGKEPVLGHPVGSKLKTHWLIYIKD